MIVRKANKIKELERTIKVHQVLEQMKKMEDIYKWVLINSDGMLEDDYINKLVAIKKCVELLTFLEDGGVIESDFTKIYKRSRAYYKGELCDFDDDGNEIK